MTKSGATKTNIINTFNNISSKIGENDHLFVFMVGQGGTDDFMTKSYICLWNNQKMYDYELANLVRPITDKNANVNVVIGQSYAGGFIDDLSINGCVVAAACSGSGSSYGSAYHPPFIDFFVNYWTSAVNGFDFRDNPTDANIGTDPWISMEEAFNYAKSHDDSGENPIYASTPVTIGEELAFDHLPPLVDLYIEVTKRVYSIGNERVLVAHYGNRLRISKLSTALFFCALRNLQRTLRMQR